MAEKINDLDCAVCACYGAIKALSKTLGTSISEKETKCEYCHEYLKTLAEDWITQYWGERCPEYEPECVLCRAWASFDYLFKNEDDELTEEDKKDIAEAMEDVKAGRVYLAEEVYKELGLTGKKEEVK